MFFYTTLVLDVHLFLNLKMNCFSISLFQHKITVYINIADHYSLITNPMSSLFSSITLAHSSNTLNR
jgi:hypothetical protein